MSNLFEVPVTFSVLGSSLRYIEDALFVAGNYGGKAFGSFVYDVIVPRMNDPLCDVSLGVINIWFAKENHAIQFIEDMKAVSSDCAFELVTVNVPNLMERECYDWQIYNLYIRSQCIARFYITISEEFQGGDFDVNCLTYVCQEDQPTGLLNKQLQGEKGYTKETLIEAINSKQATMLQDYFDKAKQDTELLNKVNNFTTKGWTVNIGTGRFGGPTTQTALHIALDSKKKDVTEQNNSSNDLLKVSSATTRYLALNVKDKNFQHIEDSLCIAGKYEGKAFGEFVCEVIVPQIHKLPYNLTSDVIVGMWFKRLDQFRLYIKERQNTTCSFYKVDSLGIHDYMMVRYGYVGDQYALDVQGTRIARFDIFISQEFPVDGFITNCLTCLCAKDCSTGQTIVSKLLKSEIGREEQLIKLILNKQTAILDGHFDKVINDYCDGVKRLVDNINRLISKGWTVEFEGYTISNPTSKAELSLVLNSNNITKSFLIENKLQSQTSPVIVKEQNSVRTLDDILNDIVEQDALITEAIAKRTLLLKECVQQFNIINPETRTEMVKMFSLPPC